jgi:hypothetical protein
MNAAVHLVAHGTYRGSILSWTLPRIQTSPWLTTFAEDWFFRFFSEIR